jgi:transcriptional regulator with XRE-family HTH domain
MKLGARIKKAREAEGLSQKDLAREIGISQAAINNIENGKTTKSKYLPEIGARLGLDAGPREVPVIGYVGAGAKANYFAEAQGPFDEVPGPVGATSVTVAVEIRGESLGNLFDGWIVFYDDVQRPVTEELIGKLCVVGLADDRVLIKQIKRSRTRGLFHLLSQTEPPITDVQLLWAAPVRSIAPRQ